MSTKSKKTGLSKTAKKQVKKIVRGQIETKTAGHILWNGTQFNSSIGVTDPVPILPQFPQGLSDATRIGDKVNIIGCTVRGTLSWQNDELDAEQPIRVRLLCLSQKDIKVQSNLSNFTYNRLLKVNDVAVSQENIGYTGAPTDNLMPINTELFTVHYDKQFDLIPSFLGDSGPAAGAVAGLVKNFHQFSFKCPTPKKLTFSNASDSLCNNACPFLVMGYVYPSGQSPDSISTRVIGYAHAITKFKDA